MLPTLPDHLRAHLNAASRYDAEYGASLSNHLPMALAALARLGASDPRCAEFAARYATRLHAAPPIEPWPAGDAWAAPLGDPRAWPIYRGLWREWMAHEGAADMLAQVLPRLMRGVGAAAFHGLIRTAYALQANHADELADALAYWSCRWFEVALIGAGEGSRADAWPMLAALDLSADLPPHALIAEAMAQAALHPRFAPALAAWFVDARNTLPQLAQLAAERYAAGADFTVLHLVTSAHAMRVLLPWLADEDQRAALIHYAQAYAAAWATVPRSNAVQPAAPVLPWPEIAARAIGSDDEHAIKLIDSCREQEAAYGGGVWSVAASRAVAGV